MKTITVFAGVLLVAVAAGCGAGRDGPREDEPSPAVQEAKRRNELLRELNRTRERDAKDQMLANALARTRDQPRIVTPAADPKSKVVAVVPREAALGKLRRGAVADSLVVGPDGKSVVYVCSRGEKWVVVRDDREGAEYDRVGTEGGVLGPASKRIDTALFSPDGKRLAYRAKAGDRELIVVDGVEHEVGGRFVEKTFVFSPDSKHFAFVARTPGGERVVTDMGTGKEYTQIDPDGLTFSADGRRLAYPAYNETRAGDAHYLVIDGTEIPGAVKRPSFSPDGKRLAYERRVDADRRVVVVGDETFNDFADGPVVFSPDGKHFAYIAFRSDFQKRVLVFDGREAGVAYDHIAPRSLVFNSNGLWCGFVASKGAHKVVVVSEQEGVEADDCRDLTFSPDGERIAYVARSGGTEAVVTDGKEGKRYPTITPESLRFNPDGRHVAYLVGGGRGRVVVDGVESDELPVAPLAPLVFDGPTRLRGVALKGTDLISVEVHIVIGGE